MSSREKSNDDNTKKLEDAAADNGGGSSLKNAAKNRGSRRTRNWVKKERPREAPVSKFQDLLIHGVKARDSDHDDFYESLLKGRRELDAWQDQNDSSPSPKETTLSKFEDSSNSEAKNKNQALKVTATRVKKERPREAPVSKFQDLIMHGVKPWDPDADDFYDSLLEARRELDQWLDKNSSPSPKKEPLSKFQDSSSSEAKNQNKKFQDSSSSESKNSSPSLKKEPLSKFQDSSSSEAKNKNKTFRDSSSSEAKNQSKKFQDSSSSEAKNMNKNQGPKLTARVKKERPREAPVSKFDDLIMHGVKPWDLDADDFYDSLLEARRELDEWLDKNPSPEEETPLGKFQDSDADDLYGSPGEFDPHCQDEGSEINPYQNFGIDPLQDEHSCHGEDSGICPSLDEDSGICPSLGEDSSINPCQDDDLCHGEDSGIDPSQNEEPCHDEDSGSNPYQSEEPCHDEDFGIGPCQDEDSRQDEGSGIVEPGQDKDSDVHGYQYDESDINPYGDVYSPYDESEIIPYGDVYSPYDESEIILYGGVYSPYDESEIIPYGGVYSPYGDVNSYGCGDEDYGYGLYQYDSDY